MREFGKSFPTKKYIQLAEELQSGKRFPTGKHFPTGNYFPTGNSSPLGNLPKWENPKWKHFPTLALPNL